MRLHRYCRQLDEYFSRHSRLAIILIALAGTVALALIDFQTGYELSFSLFYVIPISLVAWYAGLRPAMLISVLSAVAWEEANRLAGQVHSSAAIPVWNGSIRLGFFLFISFLLATLRRQLLREQRMSRNDMLTGISNRRGFQEFAQAEIARARRSGRPLTVVYIDLDNFKSVNDRLGHETGDDLLRVVADNLRNNFRITDTVARLGGDEFVLLLPETGNEVAKSLVAKNRDLLGEEMRRRQWPVGFSVGVLTCLAVPDSVDAMVKLADDLMYSVKTSGKDSVRFAVFDG